MTLPPYPGHPEPEGPEPGEPDDPLVAADLGGWLTRWFRIFWRSAPRLALITVLVGVAAVALPALCVGAALLFVGRWPLDTAHLDPFAVTVLVIGGVLGGLALLGCLVIGQGAFVCVMVADAAGLGMGVGDVLRLAARRAPALIGWSLLGLLVVLLGFVLLILPGVYAAVVVAATLNAAVVIERGGLRRCFDLVAGRWWATVGRLLLGNVIQWAILFGLQLVAALPLAGLGALSPRAPGGAGPTGAVLAGVAGGLVGVAVMFLYLLVSSGLGTALTVVTYAELRGRREQVTTATLARQLTAG